MKVCRICLSKDGRLYPITSYGLHALYNRLLGVLKLEEDKKLPQWVCAECGLRLMSFNKLRQKSLRSHQILTDLLPKITYITDKDINKIDREKNNLQSKLSYNVQDQGNIIEYEIDTRKSDETDMKPDLKIKEFLIDLDGGETSSNDSDECCFETAVSITENGYLLSDNASLSSNSSCTKNRLLKTLASTSLKNKDKKVQLNLKKHVDQYTNSVNKLKFRKNSKYVYKEFVQRASTEYIEDIFTIQTLSMEEQLAEFNSRQYAKSYMDAPFKCGDCFNGFHSEVGFSKHMLLHSDKEGTKECKICKTRMCGRSRYYTHMNAHKTIFRCKECSFVTKTRAQERWHPIPTKCDRIKPNLGLIH